MMGVSIEFENKNGCQTVLSKICEKNLERWFSSNSSFSVIAYEKESLPNKWFNFLEICCIKTFTFIS